MRRKKQGAKAKKKVTFITRKQLRHASCPPEDFEAVLEEQGTVRTEQLSEEQPLPSQPKQSALRLHPSTSRGPASKHRQPSPPPPPQPPLQMPPPPPLPQSQRPSKSSATAAAPTAPDFGRYLSDSTTAATLRTLVAVPSAPATSSSAPQNRPSRHPPAPASRKTEQRVLLSQCRPPVDAVDNKAVVEQMMKRLSDLLRTLNPQVAETPKTATKTAAATMHTKTRGDVSEPRQPQPQPTPPPPPPLPQPQLQQQSAHKPCVGSLTPGKYDWLVRQLAKRRRRSQAAAAAAAAEAAAAAAAAAAVAQSRAEASMVTSELSRSDSSCSVTSKWEKKLIYEK